MIAVARDDSPEGAAALLHAAREADLRQTPLAVLYVLDRATDGESGLRDEISRVLAEQDLRLDWDLHVVANRGSRADALIELTARVGADLLVVGSRRRTPIGKFLLGSTVQRVVLGAPIPVLVVKAPRLVQTKSGSSPQAFSS